MKAQQDLQSRLEKQGKEGLYSKYQELEKTLKEYEQEDSRAKGLKTVLDETAEGLLGDQLDVGAFENKLHDISESTAQWLEGIEEGKKFNDLVDLVLSVGFIDRKMSSLEKSLLASEYGKLPESAKIPLTELNTSFKRFDFAEDPAFVELDELGKQNISSVVYESFLSAVRGNREEYENKYREAVSAVMHYKNNFRIVDSGKLQNFLEKKLSVDVDPYRAFELSVRFMSVCSMLDKALLDEAYDFATVLAVLNDIDRQKRTLLGSKKVETSDLDRLKKVLDKALLEVFKFPTTDLDLISTFDSIEALYRRLGRETDRHELLKKYLNIPSAQRENALTIRNNVNRLFNLSREIRLKDSSMENEIFGVLNLYLEGKNKEAEESFNGLFLELTSLEKQFNLGRDIQKVFAGGSIESYTDDLEFLEATSLDNTENFYSALSGKGLAPFMFLIDYDEVLGILKSSGVDFALAQDVLARIDFGDARNADPDNFNNYVASKIIEYLNNSDDGKRAEDFSDKLFELGFQKIHGRDALRLLDFLSQNGIDSEKALNIAESISSDMDFAVNNLTLDEFLSVFTAFVLEYAGNNKDNMKSLKYALDIFSARRVSTLETYKKTEAELNALLIKLRSLEAKDDEFVGRKEKRIAVLEKDIAKKSFDLNVTKTALIRNQVQFDLASEYVFSLKTSVSESEINSALDSILNLYSSVDLKFMAGKYDLPLSPIFSSFEAQEKQTYFSLSEFKFYEETLSDRQKADVFTKLKYASSLSESAKTEVLTSARYGRIDKFSEFEREMYLEVSQGEMGRLLDLSNSLRRQLNEKEHILRDPHDHTSQEIEGYRQLLDIYYGVCNKTAGKILDLKLFYKLYGDGEDVFIDKEAYETSGALILVESDLLSDNLLDLNDSVGADSLNSIERCKADFVRLTDITGMGEREAYESLGVTPTEFQRNLMFFDLNKDFANMSEYSLKLYEHQKRLDGVQGRLMRASDSLIPLWHGGIADDPVEKVFDDALETMSSFNEDLFAARGELISTRDRLRDELKRNDEFFENNPELKSLSLVRKKIIEERLVEINNFLTNPASPFSNEARENMTASRLSLAEQKIDYLRGAAFNLAALATVITVTVASAGAAAYVAGVAGGAMGVGGIALKTVGVLSAGAGMTVGTRAGMYVSDIIQIEGENISNFEREGNIDWSASSLAWDFAVNTALMGATMGGARLVSSGISRLGSASTKFQKVASWLTRERHILKPSGKIGTKITKAGETKFIRSGVYLGKETSEELVQNTVETVNPVLGFLVGVMLGTKVNLKTQIPGLKNIGITPEQIGLNFEGGKPVYDTSSPEVFVENFKSALEGQKKAESVDLKINEETGIVNISFEYKSEGGVDTKVEIDLPPSKKGVYKRSQKLYKSIYSIEGARIDRKSNTVIFPENTVLADHVGTLRDNGFRVFPRDGKFILKHSEGFELRTNLDQEFDTLLAKIDGIEFDAKNNVFEINDASKFIDIINKLQFMGLIPMKTDAGFRVSDGVKQIEIKVDPEIVHEIETDLLLILENINKIYEIYKTDKPAEEYTAELQNYFEGLRSRLDKYGLGLPPMLSALPVGVTFTITDIFTTAGVVGLTYAGIKGYVAIRGWIGGSTKFLKKFSEALSANSDAIRDFHTSAYRTRAGLQYQPAIADAVSEMAGAVERVGKVFTAYSVKPFPTGQNRLPNFRLPRDVYAQLKNSKIYENLTNNRKKYLLFGPEYLKRPGNVDKVIKDIEDLQFFLFDLNTALQNLGYTSTEGLRSLPHRQAPAVAPGTGTAPAATPGVAPVVGTVPATPRVGRKVKLALKTVTYAGLAGGVGFLVYYLWELLNEAGGGGWGFNLVEAAREGKSDALNEEKQKIDKDRNDKMKKADKSKIKVDRGKVDSKKDFIVDDSDLPSMTAVVDGIDQIDTAIEGGQKVVEVDPRPLPPQGQPTGGAPATRRETTSRPAIDGSGEVVQRHPVQERSGKRERASNWQRIDLNGLASESESLPQAVRPRTEYPSAEELKVQPSVTSPAPDANVQRTGGESDKKKPEMDRTRSPDINRYRLKLDL